ncbi:MULTISPECIES: 4-hydroxyphenylpyruvate dioxygenase [unclassified Kitasatospora]|uniref:4-hydroxyphenylpyruvate dioxygenase n=1 Tax=unclassified Kitasatospora TaxID=2633591 RepID=UPI00070B20AA|nr:MULTISPECIES: 4-hydroxyphenylpyruvate dioxygenase [unclassified Kitasatospora]KQV13284.1 4-hydroxyphenylpyruvate dioxygenase [Kitasatospora sp. Root107]KRB75268.1 4-hydroxyphenylpyruvate dioxygenase [Kitasatospora sp. Root187]
MDFLGVDHVEFYVGDARQAAFVLCSGFGFRLYGQGGPETGLPGQRSLLLGQGDCRVLLTSGLTPDHPAVEYVARHGDGVAVIAFGTRDAAAAYAGTVASGATAVEAPRTYACEGSTVVTATVSGFGDVVHRLVERRGAAREFLPGVIEMLDLPPLASPELLQSIDHAAVCVPDGQLDSTTQYYRKAFGFEVIFEEYIEVGTQGMFSQVVQSPGGGITLTLIQPDLSRSPGQIDNFLAWHDGPGVQHLALGSRDIVAAVDAMAERGVGFAVTPDSYYSALDGLPLERLRRRGVLLDRDHWGELYQIFATSMHVRRTFFWELIERHGARTFGTSNIPALYEAKERELAR